MKKKIVLKKSLGEKIGETLRAYARTQLLLVVVVTVIVGIVLSFLGIKYSLLLAFLTGALSTIPVLGIITAALLASVIATFDNMRFFPNLPEVVEGLVVVGIYALLNFLTDTFLSPYLTSKITDVHPLVIFISVIIGSALFGIVGAFLAVPVLLILVTVRKHFEAN